MSLLIFVLMISLPVVSMAQKQNNFWYFGHQAALDFSQIDPVPVTNSRMDSPEGAAAISDTTGQLLFYTDGVSVWNAFHEKINANDLSGDPTSTQSATIVPDPDTPDDFFLFTTRSWDTTSQTNWGGNFYKIRMKTGETGSIIYDYSAATGQDGLWTGLTEKFLAVPFLREDGKTGYWFIMHEFNSDNFVIIKYDGVLGEPRFQIIGSPHTNGDDDDGTNRGAAGQMKVNDVGTKIALAVEGGRFFELFNFNKTTGVLSNWIQIPAGGPSDKFAFTNRAYGVEFSPTGQYGFIRTSQNFLYGSARDGYVYQWNLSQTNLQQFIKTGQIVYSNPEREFGGLQMGPNDKIYLAFNGQDFLGIIKSSMRPFPGCQFEANGARLTDNETNLGGISGLGLPTGIPVLKDPEPFYFSNLCEGDKTLFYITDQYNLTSSVPRTWSYKPKEGGNYKIFGSSTLNDFSFKFPAPGSYTIKLTVFKSGAPVEYTRDIVINPLPIVKMVAGAVRDTVILCKGSVLELDPGNAAFYKWEDETIRDRKRTVTTNDDPYNPYSEYRVEVTDFHGCTGWDTVWTKKEIPPTATHSSIKAFCGAGDGSATVIPNGRIENYSYVWEGYPDEESNVLSGINGGDYVVHVIKKTTGCEVTDTIHVEELGGSNVKISSSGDSVVCPGTTVVLSVTGAAEFEWVEPFVHSGMTIEITPDSTIVVTGKAISRDEGRECETFITDTIRVSPRNVPKLGPDLTPCGGNPILIDGGEDYTEWSWSNGQVSRYAKISNDVDPLILLATDLNGCVFSDTINVHFLPGPRVDLGRDIAACSKEPVELYGGEGDSYLWSTGETTQTIQVSENGYYHVTIAKDGCSISDTVHVQLNDPGLLQIESVSHTDITCYGAANGTISVVAGGDGKDFYYSIDNGLTYLDNGGVFENLTPGSNYFVKVLEDSVCVAEGNQIVLSQPDSLIAKFCSLPPECPTCANGMIALAMISGGTPPYQIRMNGEIQDSIIKDLGYGTYEITVSDSHECTAIVTIELVEGTRPAIIPSVTEPVCSGSAVLLQVVNSMLVEWLNPAGNVDKEIIVSPRVTTTYRVKSIKTDAENFVCETILEYTVEVIPFIKPDLGDDIMICIGETIDLDGGDYVDWTWSNQMVGRNIQVTTTVDPLILSVTDINGCALKDTLSVIFSPHPEVNLGGDQSLCSSDPVILSGGTGDSYYWSTEEVTSSIAVLTSGQYSLTLTRDGCSSSDSVRIRILDPSLLSINEVTVDDNLCYGDTGGSVEILVEGSGSSYQYSIDGGDNYQAVSRFDNLAAGNGYRIRIVEDSLCTVDWPEPVIVGQPDSINISFRLKSPSCETCRDGELLLDITGGTPPYQILLAGVPAGLSSVDLPIGPYTIEVTDANQCYKSTEFKLDLLTRIPNVITANGDGVNDYWKIPMLQYYQGVVVRVFSGTGKLVYESQPGYPVPWDGRDNGNQLSMGTYYYLIDLGNGEKPMTGYLTILR